MNLTRKKGLAARTFNVGKERIVFIESRINEIKEAITKQDMRDLLNEGAIMIKNIHGTKRNTKKKKTWRSPGNIKKMVFNRKREYITITRKLRSYLKEMKNQGKIPNEDFLDLRKKIRNRFFKSKASLKEYMGGKTNENTKKKKKWK